MTGGRRPRDPRRASLGIVVALGVAGLAVGGALALALGGRSGLSSASAAASAVASVESSAAPPIGSPSVGPASNALNSAAASDSSAASSFGGPSSSAGAPSASAAPPPPSGTRASIDSSLLSILPATVGGLAVRQFPEAEQQAVSDPNVGQNVVRIATAFIGDANGANWAYVAVVDLRPGAGTDAFHRDWRDSFDASACERAGGVAGHSTIVIAGRSVERANCGSGVRTYHVLVTGTSLLVSLSDFGADQIGQQVLGALTP